MTELIIDVNHDCGKTVKRLRQIDGMSLDVVAKILGISPSYLSEIENGKKNIDIKFIQKFMFIFNKNFEVSDFFILHEYLNGIGCSLVECILHDRKIKY